MTAGKKRSSGMTVSLITDIEYDYDDLLQKVKVN